MISKRTLIKYLFGCFTKFEDKKNVAWFQFVDIDGKHYVIDARDGILFSLFREMTELNQRIKKIGDINTTLSDEISKLKLKLEEKKKPKK